jgi:proteasome accessory factor C
MAVYGQRVSEIPRLLEALWAHPDGLSMNDLAVEVNRTVPQVREALLAYYLADFAAYVPDLVARPAVIEFFGGSEDVDSEHPEPMVRLVTNQPGKELGVAYAPAPELLSLYRAGGDRLQLEPQNAVLDSAVQKLRDGLLPGVQPGGYRPEVSPAEFFTAIQDHHKVRVTYARAWQPGVIERVVDPYRLIRTRRGWELDVGPPDEQGRIRTFLLNGVQTHEVLDESFDPPHDVHDLVRRHRKQLSVELVVPHDSRWAVDKYAEKVEVLEEHETSVRLRVHLLEPVRQRVGLILLAGGAAARVAEPAALSDAGQELARTLLEHHRSSASD